MTRAEELASVWSLANAHRLSTQSASSDGGLVERLATRLARPGVVAVAGLLGGRTVTSGFGSRLRDAAGTEHEDAAHVSLIAVVPEHWGRGFGRRTLEYLEDQLRLSGYTRAEMHVLETNQRARRLYDRSGWQLVRLGDEHPEGPQAVYTKRLRER